MQYFPISALPTPSFYSIAAGMFLCRLKQKSMHYLFWQNGGEEYSSGMLCTGQIKVGKALILSQAGNLFLDGS